MRATRAYIAGFGTAGSLLAGAAIAFVLASAVVAVRGWPQIGYHASVSSLRLSAPRPSSRSAAVVHLTPRKAATAHRTATHPATAHARASSAVGSVGSAGTATPHVQSARAHSSFSATVAPRRRPPVPSPRATSTSSSSTAASTPRCQSCSTSSPTTPASPSPSLTNQVSGLVQGATNTLQNTVTTTSQNLGSTVNNVVGGLP